VPLFYDEVVRLVHKDVEGLTTNPMNLLNLKRVYKK
jgi:peptide/nickel transport system substrate-binding protein